MRTIFLLAFRTSYATVQFSANFRSFELRTWKGFSELVISKVSTFRMEEHGGTLLDPPNLQGMKTLNREAFFKKVKVPCLILKPLQLRHIKALKKYFLKVVNLKPVVLFEEKGESFRRILLSPNFDWDGCEECIREELRALEISRSDFSHIEVSLKYENWNADAILRAVIPKDIESVSGYSVVGHIVHLNLRDHVLEYKDLIGQVLLDKVKTAKTVVNKLNKIDNEYRNFQMEILCGENNFITQTRENKCVYEFDFSTVYWNPRLSTEHERVVNLLKENDVLFDVFCGVGPFSIPAAKKKCLVYANDLNPESYKWLNHNIKLNKVKREYVSTFNKDAREFILIDVKENMLRILKNRNCHGRIHITMNLPALAIEFLKYFQHLLNAHELGEEIVINDLPIFHIYCFVTGDNTHQLLVDLFKNSTPLSLTSINNYKVHFVRNVSPQKNMFRIELSVPKEYLISNDFSGEPPSKKLCE